MYLYIICLAVSFGACVIGSICGVGGGVIIKPLLDSTGMMTVSEVSFLSGCTVLAMTAYSVLRDRLSGERVIEGESAVPLGIGAAAGGLAGKSLFRQVSGLFTDQDMAGAVQAACLIVITLGILIYTLRKSKIRTKDIHSFALTCIAGFLMGIISSFLGIGGGPINLIFLFYLFSMDTKTAAGNSLFIILISQASSLISTVLTRTVPDVSVPLLLLMICGGILGGAAGRRISRQMDEKMADRLFILLLILIILISCFNIWRFIG